MIFLDEQMRIFELYKLYKLILEQGAEVVDVTNINQNEYLVTLSIKKHKKESHCSGRKGVCGLKKINVTWYQSQTIILKPTENA